MGYFAFAVYALNSLIGAFSPRYLELSSEQLQALSKDDLVQLVESAISGHKEMTEYAWLTVESYMFAVVSLGLLLLILVSLVCMLSWGRHNKGFNRTPESAGPDKPGELSGGAG